VEGENDIKLFAYSMMQGYASSGLEVIRTMKKGLSFLVNSQIFAHGPVMAIFFK